VSLARKQHATTVFKDVQLLVGLAGLATLLRVVADSNLIVDILEADFDCVLGVLDCHLGYTDQVFVLSRNERSGALRY